MNNENDDRRKPVEKSKPRKTSRQRMAYHKAYHHDIWSGLIGMPGDQVGVYWRIILLMYIRRAAISDSDIEIAQLCHEPLKNYRRIKKALIARGRIVVDEEHGILYDQRAIHELVDAGYLSEENTARAMRRWNPKTPPRVIVDNTARCDELVPLAEADENKIGEVLADVGLKSPLKSSPSTCPSSFSLVGNQTLSSPDRMQKTHAYQNPESISEPTSEKPAPGPAAQPPKGGGGPGGAMDVKARRRAAEKALEEHRRAKQAPAPDPETTKTKTVSKAADRRARRA